MLVTVVKPNEFAEYVLSHLEDGVCIDFDLEFNPITKENSEYYAAECFAFGDALCLVANYYGGGRGFVHIFRNEEDRVTFVNKFTDYIVNNLYCSDSVYVEDINTAPSSLKRIEVSGGKTVLFRQMLQQGPNKGIVYACKSVNATDYEFMRVRVADSEIVVIHDLSSGGTYLFEPDCCIGFKDNAYLLFEYLHENNIVLR
jgi:hypothetical protein